MKENENITVSLFSFRDGATSFFRFERADWFLLYKTIEN